MYAQLARHATLRGLTRQARRKRTLFWSRALPVRQMVLAALGSLRTSIHTHTHTNIRGQMASNQRLQFSFTPYRCRKHTPQVLLAQYRRVCGMASFSLHTNERVTQQMLQCASVLVCQCRLRSIQRRGKILGGRPLLPLPSSPLSQILFALTHDRQRTRKQRTWLGHSAFLHTCNLLGHCTQRNKDTRQKCEGKIDGGT